MIIFKFILSQIVQDDPGRAQEDPEGTLMEPVAQIDPGGTQIAWDRYDPFWN